MREASANDHDLANRRDTTTAHARIREGGCRCGGIRLRFVTTLREFAPRACDCAFCRRHDARWISDPHGSLALSCDPEHVRYERQGSGQARFLFCTTCNALVAVLYQDGDACYAAINAARLTTRDGLLAPTPVSPGTLGARDKTSRWKRLWIADVDVRPPPRD